MRATRRESSSAAGLFADALGGHQLFANNSKWLTFNTVRNERWGAGNVVLVGDAAHTAHFSIGSGTKLAMEDAAALAWALRSPASTIAEAIAAYEAERRPIVESTQRAAQASLEWFEGLGRYVDQGRTQFAFNLLTRSRRVTYDNLRLRDPGFVEEVDADFAYACGIAPPRPPMFMPMSLRGLTLSNRVVVSAMDMYSAVDGVPGDFHLVHLGARVARRCGIGDERNDLRFRYRADHARVRRYVQRRADGSVAADRRVRARPWWRCRDRGAARPFGSQGLHEADVGGDRSAARRRQLAVDRALGRLVFATLSGAAGDDACGHGCRAVRSS